jgi:ankyrin repeat protein
MQKHIPVLVCIIHAVLLAGCSRNEGITPLMLAARAGNTDEVKKILSAGSNPNERSQYGWTALMFASWQGHLEPVTLLLDAGADPNNISTHIPSAFETTLGYPPSTALREAISHKHMDIANTLIDRGALIDAHAIALAGGAGDIGFLKRLKQLGADPNASANTAFYATPLITAAANRNLEAVVWLIENGANPNQMALSQTALKTAVRADEPRIVRYLLEYGANPNLVYDSLGETALFYAATKHTAQEYYPGNLLIMEMLLSHGADPKQKAFTDECTALEFVEKQKANAVKYYNNKGKDIDQTKRDASILHYDNIIDLLKKHTK